MSSELPRQCIYITNLNYMANVGDGVLRNIRSNVWSGEAGGGGGGGGGIHMFAPHRMVTHFTLSVTNSFIRSETG